MVQALKDLLGIVNTDYDYIIITFSCVLTYQVVSYLFGLITIPINTIVKAVKKEK